ncbi:MAG: STAS domain-containing protein [Clostridia bacterium]|nr:STAS domain-containing protein [Clostridia bacterium]
MLNTRMNKTDETLTFYLEGDLDRITSADFEKEIFACLSDVTELVIDLEQLEYISSAGLRSFVKLQKQMDKQGTMRLVHVKPGVFEIFDLGGFTDYLTIEAD